MKKLVVAGGGVLGSQIAFQAAYSGVDVVIWLHSKSTIEQTQAKLNKLAETYAKCINDMASKHPEVWCSGISTREDFNKKYCLRKVKNADSKITLELDLEKAVSGADLLIESITEKKEIKIDFYKKLEPLLDAKTIVATNSSTLLPSTFAKYTGRPSKYLSMHFANSIWKNNITEIMAQPETSDRTFNFAIKAAGEIGMVPLPVNKEKSGYLLNSMLVPFLLSALDLVANKVSDPQSIDKAWTTGTGSPKGPFVIIDTVGLETTYNIVEQYQKVPTLINPLLKKMMLPYNFRAMKRLLKSYIDEGKLGKSAGEGFYKY
jgi:3-hydroxyacyl-CoA dehydrogenase